jgi:hypothetical protein
VSSTISLTAQPLAENAARIWSLLTAGMYLLAEECHVLGLFVLKARR